jgi:RimJ/RimL family protein N-acetyltransferase
MLPGEITTLRALDRADLKNAVAWLNDPALRRLVASYKPMSMSEEDRWYERMLQSSTDQVFAIDRSDDGADGRHVGLHIGLCGIHEIQWKNRCATVGILIGDAALHGKGYGTDAMRSLVRYAHDELALHRVSLEVFTDNTRAIRSYEKLGFMREGVRRQAMWKDGAFRDLLVMSVLPGELRAAPSPKAPPTTTKRRAR